MLVKGLAVLWICIGYSFANANVCIYEHLTPAGGVTTACTPTESNLQGSCGQYQYCVTTWQGSYCCQPISNKLPLCPSGGALKHAPMGVTCLHDGQCDDKTGASGAHCLPGDARGYQNMAGTARFCCYPGTNGGGGTTNQIGGGTSNGGQPTTGGGTSNGGQKPNPYPTGTGVNPYGGYRPTGGVVPTGKGNPYPYAGNGYPYGGWPGAAAMHGGGYNPAIAGYNPSAAFNPALLHPALAAVQPAMAGVAPALAAAQGAVVRPTLDGFFDPYYGAPPSLVVPALTGSVASMTGIIPALTGAVASLAAAIPETAAAGKEKESGGGGGGIGSALGGLGGMLGRKK